MKSNFGLKIRRWVSLIFGKNKKINEIVQTQVNEAHYNSIETWKQLYAGYCDDIHKVSYQTIAKGTQTRTMHSLKMPKVVSQELAKLIFTEKVQINIDNEEFSENIKQIFTDSRFYKVFQSKVENMFALGGLVLKAHPKENEDGTYKLAISYVTPDCFIPVSWENDEITEGVFLKITRKGDKVYVLFEFHNWDTRAIKRDNGDTEYEKVYIIRNELHEGDKNGQEVKQVPLELLYPELEKETVIEGLTHSMFQYIRPNIANNFDLQSPLGISIFANSIDTLKAIDTAFDSFIREFKLGRRRIIVPSQAVKSVVDPTTGQMERYFDASDESYEAFNFQDAEKQKIQDNTVSLRVDEHVAGLNALLNLLAMQIGFSPGIFTFDGQGVKTATEVVSENSKTYQTKQINEEILEEGLTKFIRSIGEVAELYEIFSVPEEYDIEFYWDDTILKDKYADTDYYIKLKTAGLMPAYRVIMEVLDLPEEDARKYVEEVREENRSMSPEMEDVLGDVE